MEAEVSEMDDEKFWAIVDECHTASGGDMNQKDQQIKTAINRLSSNEALAFYQTFIE